MLPLPAHILFAFSLIASIWAAPTPSPAAECTLTFPSFNLVGHPPANGACRYTVQYGQAGRWEDSVTMMDQTEHDSTALPPACPQAADRVMLKNAPSQDEQCLYAVVYAPKDVKRGDGLPIFVWVHGGSYYAGSASAPGLDGSTLAVQGKMIVVVLQYRLGILGLLPPTSSPTSGDPNLAVKDVILALAKIQSYAEWIGGDPGKVTIGGQSSGASLIRALLAAPQAKRLFRAAILQSDPMTYGTAPADTTAKLSQMFYTQPIFSFCSTLDCFRRVPLNMILAGQAKFMVAAPSLLEGVPLVTPFRPTHQTPTIPLEPTSQTFSAPLTLPNSPMSISLLITTTANEAGQVVGSIFPQPVPASNTTFAGVLSVFVNPDRARMIVSGPEYALRGGVREDELRVTFERLVTDGVWRCASRDFAAKWAGRGGKVWTGEWMKGVGYVNDGGAGSYCAQAGRVCHEDDIFPTFHSSPSSSAEAVRLQDEVLLRWTSFIHTLDPNPLPKTINPTPSPASTLGSVIAVPLLPGGVVSDRGIPPPVSANCSLASSARGALPTPAGLGQETNRQIGIRVSTAALPRWEMYKDGGSGQVYAIGGGEVKVCPAGYWGNKVKYDWQLYP